MDLQDTSGAQIAQDPGSDYLITIQVEPQYEAKLNADRLHRLAIGVLRAEGAQGPLELGVVITTDDEVLTLNQQYLGHDYKTDVLSFGMEGQAETEAMPPRFVSPPERPRYLGDIAISYDRAAEQAPEYGHSVDSEVATLLIHGILHLLGYDDAQDAERQQMQARQQGLLEIYYEKPQRR